MTPCRYIFAQTWVNPLLTCPESHAVRPSLFQALRMSTRIRNPRLRLSVHHHGTTEDIDIVDFSHLKCNRGIPVGTKPEGHRVSPNTLLLPFAPKTTLVRSIQNSILFINPITEVLVLVSREVERLVRRSKRAENRGPSNGSPRLSASS